MTCNRGGSCKDSMADLLSRTLQDRKVNLSLTESGDNDVCFQYYRDKVFQVYRKTGMSEERIRYGIKELFDANMFVDTLE